MRLAVNELHDLMQMIDKRVEAVRKQERDYAKGILNQRQQHLRVQASTLAQKMLEATNRIVAAPDVQGVKDILVNFADRVREVVE